MQRLAQIGALSRCRFFEAIDYTPERAPKNQKHVVIHSFMAHHQAMSPRRSWITSCLEDVMQKAFSCRSAHSSDRAVATRADPTGTPIAQFRTEEVLRGRIVNTLIAPLAVVYELRRTCSRRARS